MLVFRAVNVGITKLGRFELVEKVMWASRSKVKMKKSQVKHTHDGSMGLVYLPYICHKKNQPFMDR